MVWFKVINPKCISVPYCLRSYPTLPLPMEFTSKWNGSNSLMSGMASACLNDQFIKPLGGAGPVD